MRSGSIPKPTEANLKKPELSHKHLIPQEYHKYLDISNENKANKYSEPRPWDHKIEMKPGFEPKSFKTYNLTPREQFKLDKFLKETWIKDISNHQSLLWLPHSPL